MQQAGEMSFLFGSVPGALAVGIAAAGLLVTLRVGSGASKFWLACLFCALGLLTFIFLAAGLAPLQAAVSLPFALPLIFAIPVCLYIYVRCSAAAAMPASASPLTDLHSLWVHLALPALGLVIAAGYLLLPKQDRRSMFLAGELPAGMYPATLALITFVLVIAWNAVSAGYLIAIMRLLARYRARLRDLYSNLARREMRWVEGFALLLVCLWLAAAALLLADNLWDHAAFGTGFLYVLMGAALLFLIAFSLPPPTPQTSTNADEESPEARVHQKRYAKSALNSDMASRISVRLEAAMHADALYLDPNLSLDKLARRIGVPANYLSQTLNETLGVNFFDYVNRWRIVEARRLIETTGMSVLEVALGAAFNSRSTFYKAFKKECGESPTVYRNRVREAQARDTPLQ